jgi:hypothetical protein
MGGLPHGIDLSWINENMELRILGSLRSSLRRRAAFLFDLELARNQGQSIEE